MKKESPVFSRGTQKASCMDPDITGSIVLWNVSLLVITNLVQISPCNVLILSRRVHSMYFRAELDYSALQQPCHILYARDTPHIFGRDISTIIEDTVIFPWDSQICPNNQLKGQIPKLHDLYKWFAHEDFLNLGKMKESCLTPLCLIILFAPCLWMWSFRRKLKGIIWKTHDCHKGCWWTVNDQDDS